VTADGNSQPLEGGVQFLPALGYPSPLSVGGLPPNQVGVAWSLYSNPFQPALTGTQQIGKLRFVIPQYARSSHSYTVHFANADGSPMPIQNYTFETVPGTVWVLAPALRPLETVSDEWKVKFFGSYTAAAAQDDADPDGDGVSNAAEYLAGTDPTSGASKLVLSIKAATGQVVLKWLTAPGHSYIVEGSTNLQNWSPLGASVPGTGDVAEVAYPNPSGGMLYYRVRLEQ
jgi:hypothetical protein